MKSSFIYIVGKEVSCCNSEGLENISAFSTRELAESYLSNIEKPNRYTIQVVSLDRQFEHAIYQCRICHLRNRSNQKPSCNHNDSVCVQFGEML